MFLPKINNLSPNKAKLLNINITAFNLSNEIQTTPIFSVNSHNLSKIVLRNS